MVEIVAGELKRNETNKNARGGTEYIAEQMHKLLPQELLKNFQIIHSRKRELRDDLKRILVCHDLPGDGEVEHLKNGGWKQYEKVVFVSNWQMQMYNLILGVPYSHSIVLQNAIYPLEMSMPPDDGKIRLIYHTTPHRGLDILYDVFNELTLDFDNLQLDVFSSFKIYGWEQRDKEFENLFDKLKNHNMINYHGTQPNDVVRKQLEQSHIFSYPSTWLETSCIALMEAMSAGIIAVHPNYGALPETASNFTLMYQWNENKQDHAVAFYDQMYDAIEMAQEGGLKAGMLEMQKQYADAVYSWSLRKDEWEYFLESLL